MQVQFNCDISKILKHGCISKLRPEIIAGIGMTVSVSVLDNFLTGILPIHSKNELCLENIINTASPFFGQFQGLCHDRGGYVHIASLHVESSPVHLIQAMQSIEISAQQNYNFLSLLLSVFRITDYDYARSNLWATPFARRTQHYIQNIHF